MATDIVNMDDVKIMDTISFKTYNQYDNVSWKGQLIGIGGYDIVGKLDDVLPYYQNVKKSHPDVPDYKDSIYWIMNAYENGDTTTPHRRVIAKDWIDQSTLRIIDFNKSLDFRVFNATEADKQKIVDILSDNGYSISFLSMN